MSAALVAPMYAINLELVISIRSDRTAPYRYIDAVQQELSAAGVLRVVFATELEQAITRRDDERASNSTAADCRSDRHGQRAIQEVVFVWFWGSMITATVLHFVVFALWPEMAAEDVSVSSDELEAIELPPEVEIPPPPAAIRRPATPVIATAQIDEDITIAQVTFEANPVGEPPSRRPREDVETDISAAPVFTPYTVAPDYTNATEVTRALEREYPPCCAMPASAARYRSGSSSTR